MWRESIEQGSYTLPRCVDGSFGGFAQEELELGEDLLDRIEVRRVGREEQQPCSDRTDRLADGSTLVTAEVVHVDDVAGIERWHEELHDPGGEALTIDWSVEHARRIDPVVPQGGHEGQRTPFAERGAGDELVTAWRPAPDRRHIRLGPGLVDEDEAARIKPALIFLPLLSPPRDPGPHLLDGEQRFF